MAIPKLRFKEFDEDWSSSKIGELFQVTSGATPLRSNKIFFENADIPWVKTTDLNNSFITHTEEQISDIALKKTSVKMLPRGTVFVAMYGGFNQIGRTGLLLNESACNQALSAIYPNAKIDSFFLLSYLNHNVQGWKVFAASSRKDPNITKSDVLAFPIIYPSKEEQTKIASFLSAVDDKIAQLTQEHELLSEYKKGMMQQLFSQKLRFKADNSSGFIDWKEEKLGDCIEVFDHLRIPVTASERISGSTPYYGANGIQSYIDGYTHDGEFVLIAEDGANDVLNYPVQYVSGKIWVNNHAHVVRGKQGILNNYFLVYRISSTNITRYLVGGGRPKLNAKAMKEILFAIPCLAEQTKIANFLSAIDQKIDNVAAQIDQAKVWKKGLLQQMFV